MKFHLKSAAKVNLTLDILRQRADGYHELASVVHTVGIWDEISIEIKPDSPISFGCNHADLAGDDNLCVQAIKKWIEATGDEFGAQIYLEKRIPTGAGLGGGSGNAAAILLALNRASKNPLSFPKLNEIGAKLGADVPLFLAGGAVLMEGIGEKLTVLTSKSGWLLVVKPQESFSTPEIYRHWDAGGFSSRNDTLKLLKFWQNGDWRAIGEHLGNDLERAAAQISDLPTKIVALLRESGALGAQMSGSGSACFGIFETQNDAQNATDTLKLSLAKDVHLRSSQLFVAPFCERGVQFEIQT